MWNKWLLKDENINHAISKYRVLYARKTLHNYFIYIKFLYILNIIAKIMIIAKEYIKNYIVLITRIRKINEILKKL